MREIRINVMRIKLTAYLLLMISVSASEAAMFDYGADLRQNMLFFGRPKGLPRFLYPDDGSGMSSTAVRLKSTLRHEDLTLSAALETKLNFHSGGSGFIGDGGIFGGGTYLERWDWTDEYINDGSSRLATRLERFDVLWRLGDYDIDVGRQPVTLGTSHFVSVLDIVAPFAPGDPDATYKPGVDAVRIRRPVGVTGEAEIIGVGMKPWEEGAVLARMRKQIKSIDVELVGGRFRRRGFGGIGWEGGVGEIGVWGECALFQRRPDIESVRGWSEAAISGVAGIDVNLPADAIGGCGVMWQDFGVRAPEDLETIYTEAPYREGWLFLASVAYGVLTYHRQMHPLVDTDVSGLVNLIDGSTLWQPMVSISVADNADLSLYGWLGTGESSEYSDKGVITNSEFGSLPKGGGFYARWFF